MIHWKMYNFRFQNSSCIYTLDTETSSFWVKPDGSVIAYDASISTETNNNEQVQSAIYG